MLSANIVGQSDLWSTPGPRADETNLDQRAGPGIGAGRSDRRPLSAYLRVGKPGGLTRRDLSICALSRTRVVARDAHWRDAPARRTIVRRYHA